MKPIHVLIFVIGLTVGWFSGFFHSEKLNRQAISYWKVKAEQQSVEQPKQSVKQLKIEQPKPIKYEVIKNDESQLPEGWSMRYNHVTKKYRWVDADGFRDTFDSGNNKKEAIKSAWSFYYSHRNNDSKNWEEVK